MSHSATKRMREILAEAERKRGPFAARLGVDAFRVMNGPADGGPSGLTIDRYARWLVLAARAEISREQAEPWAEAALDALESDGLVLKTLKVPVAKSTSRVFRGTLPEAPIAVREDDAHFLCELDSGISTGLFLDHREARFFVRRFASGAEVL